MLWIMGSFKGKQLYHFILAFHLNRSQFIGEKMLHMGNFIPLREDLILERLCCLEKQTESHNICLSFKIWWKNMALYLSVQFSSVSLSLRIPSHGERERGKVGGTLLMNGYQYTGHQYTSMFPCHFFKGRQLL